MIRLLTKADAKQYWELRLQALQVNPEAFVTTYEEAVRQETPLNELLVIFHPIVALHLVLLILKIV